MVALDTTFLERQASKSANAARASHWIGASGRGYQAKIENVERFHFIDDHIYILAALGQPLWAGTNQDLIQDQDSRQHFQMALERADSVHSIQAPSDPTKRMCLVFDLQSGTAQVDRTAA